MISVDDAKINHASVAVAQTTATTLAMPWMEGMEWLLIPKDADCTAVLLVMLQRAWKRSRTLGDMVAVVFSRFVRGVGGGRAQTLRFIFHAVCQQKITKRKFRCTQTIWIVTSWFELDVLSNKVNLEDKIIVYWYKPFLLLLYILITYLKGYDIITKTIPSDHDHIMCQIPTCASNVYACYWMHRVR